MSFENDTITLEQLEALATSLEATEWKRREKLIRMIRAFVRILSIREPARFTARPTVYADEDGHWDNSYPPTQEFKQRTGPRSIQLRKTDFTNRATTGGFYHHSCYYTEVPGLSVDASGDFWNSKLDGVGQYGQFAAHPGECEVNCTIDHEIVDAGDLSTVELIDAEQQLRLLAFPSASAKEQDS